MFDLAPGHISDMDEAVNTPKIDKETIIRDIPDYPLKDRVLLEKFKCFFPESFTFFL